MLLSVQMISLPKLSKGKLDFFVLPCTLGDTDELSHIYPGVFGAVLSVGEFCGCLEERKAGSPLENSIPDVEP